MLWYVKTKFFLFVPQILHDLRMHRASTSTHVPYPEYDDTRHQYNTLEAERSMDAKRHSISSFFDLGMPTMFGAYAPTPPSAQGIGGPYHESFYYVQSQNQRMSSSSAYQGDEDQHREAKPLQEESPTPPQEKRNPSRNRQ